MAKSAKVMYLFAMGLLYIFPADEKEIDRLKHIDHKNGQKALELRTYGLPLIFWGYLVAILTIVIILGLAAKDPLLKILSGSDSINIIIAAGVIALLIFGPLLLIGFYFYEKRLIKFQNSLKISHHLFGIPFFIKNYKIDNSETQEPFQVMHHLSSPNIARVKLHEEDATELRGFQNKGYYQLFLKESNGKTIFVDRHSRKADLIKIKNLLNKY